MALHISVIIPVYNAASFVEQAVRSALQFDEVREVILVEDGSTDDSLAVCQRVAHCDARVILVQHPGGANMGASVTRNTGIARATQEFIAFLDADDLFLPERFDRERILFQELPDADGVYGAIAPHFHDAQGEALFRKHFNHELTTVRKAVPPEELVQGLLCRIKGFGHFSLNGLTVKRKALLVLDPWFKPELRLHQDTEFLIRLAWHCRLVPGSIDAPVALRGVHGNNRITRNPRPQASEVLLWEQLSNWAERAGLDRSTKRYVQLEYRLKALRSANGTTEVLKRAWQHRDHWSEFDYRDAVFDRLAGAGTRTKGLLHKLTWKYYGGAKAQV